MAKDLEVRLPNQPGGLARLGRALGDAGINIDGIAGVAVGGEGVIHVLVEDAGEASRALAEAGIDIGRERDVVVVDCQDRPGELARVAGALAQAAVNIDLVYVTASGTRLVLGVDDVEAARSAL